MRLGGERSTRVRLIQPAQKIDVVVWSRGACAARAEVPRRSAGTAGTGASTPHEKPENATQGRYEADRDPESARQSTNSGLVNQDGVDDGIDEKGDKNCDDDDECAGHSELILGSSSERRLSAVKNFPAWLPYTLLRLVSFIVPLAILLALGVEGWISALVAAVIGICVSYIFFARSRNAVALQIHTARTRKTPLVRADDAAEDAAVDATNEG